MEKVREVARGQVVDGFNLLSSSLFFRFLLENDVPKMKREYLCIYKVYLNNCGVIRKGTLVKCVQMCKYLYLCHWLRVN